MKPFDEMKLDMEMVRKCENVGKLLYYTLHKNHSCLYQWLERHHLDKGYELTQDQWEVFVENYGDVFAETVSELGVELFEDFKTRIGKEVRDDE